jgi:hypothetical protein
LPPGAGAGTPHPNAQAILEAMLSEGASAGHGHMDIHEQQGTFHHFLLFSLWGTTLILQFVALFTVAFAMNLGWWSGMAAYVVIGAGIGLFAKMSSAWWATLIGSTILLGLGGLLVQVLL